MAQGQAGGEGEAKGRRNRRYHQGRRRFVGVFTHGGKGGKGGEPLVVGAGVHGQPLEWQHLRLGQEEHGRVIAQIGLQLVIESPGVVQPRGDHDHRPLLSASGGPDCGHVQGIVSRD